MIEYITNIKNDILLYFPEFPLKKTKRENHNTTGCSQTIKYINDPVCVADAPFKNANSKSCINPSNMMKKVRTLSKL